MIESFHLLIQVISFHFVQLSDDFIVHEDSFVLTEQETWSEADREEPQIVAMRITQ